MKNTKNSIYRHLDYMNALVGLQKQGVGTVSSHNLAALCNVSASALRKDLMAFRSKGKQRIGYSVAELLNLLKKELYRDVVEKVVVVGVGSFGSALMKYNNFSLYNFQIVAGFDEDTTHRKGINLPIYKMDMLAETVKELDVTFAILTVPEIAAQPVARLLVESGIEKILNFTPAILKVAKPVKVNHVNLVYEMEYLLFGALEPEQA